MSSYLVLARKYRPKTFEEVVGQEAVTGVLAGAIEEGRVGHAYLFAGPRGTGKTTIARILARALNCEQGPTAKPCGTCERCQAADGGHEVDLIELDAASHTGVDTIRELRDEVVYAPMRARKKIYIVDEVHMLSKAAFNALLKTLEEPPPHVVFLFATTEPHKVLDTILSRCQVLKLSALPEERIAARLTKVFGFEEVEAGEGVVEELARMARGGMRDALSLADKLLALAGRTPTLEDLLRMGGETGGRQIETLLDSVERSDRSACLEQLAQVHGDEDVLVAGLLDAVRTALVLHHCGDDAPFVGASGAEREHAIGRGKRLGPERLELFLQELLRARERMRLLADQAGLVLEVALLQLCREEETVPLAELVTRLEGMEQRLGTGAQVADVARERGAAAPVPSAPSRPAPDTSAPSAPAGPEPTRGADPKPAPTNAPGPASDDRPLAFHWEGLLTELRGSHGALAALLEEYGAPDRLRETGASEVTLDLGELAPKEERQARDRRNQAACSRALSRLTGRSLSVLLRGTVPAGEGPSTPRGSTPTQPSSEERPKPPSKDALTEQVSDLFGGVIEDIG